MYLHPLHNPEIYTQTMIFAVPKKKFLRSSVDVNGISKVCKQSNKVT